ncbi:hypothetical protein [Alkalihalobacillus pseudalcaliphilus]|uniref:hypothetical protein n=1 Tax=Alkalihalobacillus pseudalcaliphilus TaxID=79884 RepID=UPI00064DA520|nr:hypothetical protein [Alkalihalobacillus pseudalcaliphilus]KMK76002.1 hypothetical protein AB990_12250 [Alkalihalobacillus pseudalcaliphilus]
MVAFTVLFFVFVVGVTIGGLLAVGKNPPSLFLFGLIAFAFLIVGFIGMVVGLLFPSFLIGFWFAEFIICIFAFLFIWAAVKTFHPNLGFMFGQKMGLNILLCLFFFMGFEWGIFDLRAFFTLFASIIFTLSLFIGIFVQWQVKQKFWHFPYVVYAPCVWLFVFTIIKLF